MVDAQTQGETPFVVWLRKAMAARGIKSNRQLGKFSGVNHSSISTILRGETGPDRDTVYRLAVFFREDPSRIEALAGFDAVERVHEYTPIDLETTRLIETSVEGETIRAIVYELQGLSPTALDYIARNVRHDAQVIRDIETQYTANQTPVKQPDTDQG